jgi:cadmium resistance protein CadD (predicted permease)
MELVVVSVFALVVSAVGVFVGTDIDDLVVLTALFGSRQVGRREIVVGQYVGIGVLVAISVVAAAGLLIVPDRWVGLFGIIPLALGIGGLVRGKEDGAVIVKTTLGVAGITLANGADNVSVYVPLFRQAGWGTIVYIAAFAVLIALWLLAVRFLASRPSVAAVLDRWGYRIVPLVFIAIGVLLIAGSVTG